VREHQLELSHALRMLGDHLAHLRARIEGGDVTAWPEYRETALTLGQLTALDPVGMPLLTTAQLAERMQCSTRTIRRKLKNGDLQPTRLGQRGRVALRWTS
jgi:excisionase family DNA binding protein